MSEKPFALSVKVVILDKNGRCLLLKRSMSSKYNKGKWDLPGGKVDTNEDFEKALLREVAEETGLKISLEKVVGSAQSETPTKKVAYIILEGTIISGEVKLSDEHNEYIWVDQSNLAKMDLCKQFYHFAKIYSGSSSEQKRDSFD
ncbi:MAG: NUDIX domain-containing protein [Phycisphaerae bacterium]|nr:NUDIX domain-containing protein [Phycisphaerae bacterium]MDD5381394.1 NUDIX domain-containing protein [Phycisphaerae bacterium]